MDNLITVITRFQLPAGVTADQIRAAFDEAAPGFRNVPGSVRKQFLRSKDCRTAGGVYLWSDERVARAFMNEHVAPMIREKFHVDPAIEFYDSPVIVENCMWIGGKWGQIYIIDISSLTYRSFASS